ncbi:hypothetical protein FOQG_15648 [Fusarium oxysporum f. sp. raphani 54005]|uniref:Uncharacterized protein n=2 Tax=Fusarium oxysporum TaxID=5507 RepID=X0BLP4_FUSOX|nr:hypothetical protein FOQG_15648 [Fusarium oxysporum f. sp. raphani 54005]EXM14974.1 hypothetical protein FOTG_16635 [Fusarium oxysporum f. sp. vasinfectum 25433]
MDVREPFSYENLVQSAIVLFDCLAAKIDLVFDLMANRITL